MVTNVQFLRFRGFEKLHASLVPHAYIVGPNSAGKSTVIEAVALAEQCLKNARRKLPTLRVEHRGVYWNGYPLPSNANDEEDPVRHDFGKQETRVTVQWDTGAKVHIVWPTEDEEDDPGGFFYLESKEGEQPRSTATTRSLYTPVTIVPVITPLERSEELKDPEYVAKNASSRLASRHFRNHAWSMSQAGDWDAYKEFCRQWLPEIELLDVEMRYSPSRLDVFYREQGSRVPKELAWAGDGIQIWVQLLWHLLRARDSKTILLDEPEVYLHPDLQRRLVRLLDSLSSQIVLASHSADVIAEAPQDGVLWIDRRLGSPRRARSQQVLTALSASLGSTFNLALARSMRSHLVIASDCKDLRVLRLLAKHVGASFVANEHLVSLVQLQQVANWSDIDRLGEIIRDFLPANVPAVVLLDGGLRPDSANSAARRRLEAPGVKVMFWSCPEIDNYLLDPETIARVSGAAEETLSLQIAEAQAGLREAARRKFISERVAVAEEGAASSALADAEADFDNLWAKYERRAELVPGTLVIKRINEWLETGGYRPISSHLLAKSIRPQRISHEVIDALLGIDELVAAEIEKCSPD
jgi:hypothetical protein